MANQRQVRVKIFSSSKRQKTYDLRDENQIADLINKDVLPNVSLQIIRILGIME